MTMNQELFDWYPSLFLRLRTVTQNYHTSFSVTSVPQCRGRPEIGMSVSSKKGGCDRSRTQGYGYRHHFLNTK